MAIHVIAAAVWIGGMVFLAAVVVPTVRRREHREHAPLLVQRMGLRFRTVGWIALLTLIATGLLNLERRGIGLDVIGEPEFWSAGFGQTLAVKLVLVAIILLMSAIHDFFIGPRASRMMQEHPGSGRALRLRHAASWMGRLNLLLGLAVLALGVMLVRGAPW